MDEPRFQQSGLNGDVLPRILDTLLHGADCMAEVEAKVCHRSDERGNAITAGFIKRLR